ncbi:MAG: hypothetical protein U1E52_18575 [Geminicoccaceae bacterium]
MLNTSPVSSRSLAEWRIGRHMILLAGVLSAPCAAYAESALGFIEKLADINSNQCLIEHAGSEPAHCWILSEVSAGDHIKIAAGGVLTLRLYSGKSKVLGSPGGTLKADSNTAGPSLLNPLRQLFATLLDRKKETGTVLAAVRGDDSRSVTAPLLDADIAALAAGQRGLALRWSGGVAPYALSIAADDPLLDLPALATAELPPQSLDLTPGDYTLTITDAKGTEIERDVEVVAADEVPGAPEDPGLAQLPAEYHTLAQAGWLSQQEDGRWRWEAWLQLQTLPPDFAPGRLLADALARGEP